MKNTYKLGLLLLVAIGLLTTSLLGIKANQLKALSEASQFSSAATATVATFEVATQDWQQSLSAVGSVESAQEVELAAEQDGRVAAIYFESGQLVTAGDLLLEFDLRVEQAQLRSAQADVRLASLELTRSQSLAASGSLTQSMLERAQADLERTRAEVDHLNALIERKRVYAPFDGKLGIRKINLGQVVAAGSPLVNLQAQLQVYVNFSLPQHTLTQLELGLSVHLSSSIFPDEISIGSLTAVSPQIDPLTRSVKVQASFENSHLRLRSGQFVHVTVNLPSRQSVTVVPATAILYAPFGNSIFKIEPLLDSSGELIGQRAEQLFIRIGERRGDFVSVLAGLNHGDLVVSAGAFKLSNNSPVQINNKLAPTPKLAPHPENS